MLDTSRIKSQIIQKFSENRAFLSNFDFWSAVESPKQFTFITSQTAYNTLKNDETIKVLEEKVASGKMSLIIEIESIKLDELVLDKLEIIQDINIKSEELRYLGSSYKAKKEFSTKNPYNQKPVKIFDIKSKAGELSFRFLVTENEFLEISLDI